MLPKSQVQQRKIQQKQVQIKLLKMVKKQQIQTNQKPKKVSKV